MAFHMMGLENFTVAQLQIIAEKRNRRGFHVHYTGGLDASRKTFLFYCPGYMINGCSLTTVFQYPAPSGRKGQPNEGYPLYLGQYNDHKDTYVRLSFAGADELAVERRYKGKKSSFATQREQNLEGIHVLEFERDVLNMKLFLDGELLLPARSITDGPDLDAHVVFATSEGTTHSPFVFYETHYTMPDVDRVLKIPAFYNPNADYYFPHKNVEISEGGYVLWYASWTPGTDVSAQNYNGDRFAPAVRNPQLGNLMLLLKIYKSGCTLSNANDYSNVPSPMPNYKRISLDDLFVKPNPVSFYEFKAVTGYMTY